MKLEFKDQSMIYISGWGVWGRVLQQTEHRLEIWIEDSTIQWYSKKEIELIMNQEEPAICEE